MALHHSTTPSDFQVLTEDMFEQAAT
jgi:hypothetical protein